MANDVHKITLQLVVLGQADSLDAFTAAYGNMTLSEIQQAIDSGEDIGGSVTITAAETLPADRVEEELLAIGNDGTFFSVEAE